jgi:hypothetical protein
MPGPYLPTSIKRQARMPAQPSRWRVLLYCRSHVALLLPLRPKIASDEPTLLVGFSR